MNKFLKDSKPMNAGLFMEGKWSAKSGGFRRAISEFKSFKPTEIKATRDVKNVIILKH